MKLKALKNHFHGTKFSRVGSVYMADIIFSGIVIRSGAAEQVKMPVRKKKTKK